ncbi:TetR/AcrR family transcriptional regulator [Agrilactobacillus yilanensis]|uniref:TetR/AcrR family transcriptional regulator n=1 Tax=Agrilactobacillus yilanensis TaxID=2485997 RepID=A0ABW4J560_9LACO|nr:TetR family transcriptional regulator [Agrilactobacillus yilanensis]
MVKRRTLSKEKVLETANEMIEAAGIEALTIRDLAEALDVRPQSIYNYVDSLGDLIDQVSLQFVNNLSEHLHQELTGVSGEAALMTFANAFRKACQEHRNIAPVLLNLNKQNSVRTHEALIELYNGIFEPLHLKDSNGRIESTLYRSTLFGFIMQEIGGFFRLNPAQVDERFEATIKLAISTMAP